MFITSIYHAWESFIIFSCISRWVEMTYKWVLSINLFFSNLIIFCEFLNIIYYSLNLFFGESSLVISEVIDSLFPVSYPWCRYLRYNFQFKLNETWIYCTLLNALEITDKSRFSSQLLFCHCFFSFKYLHIAACLLFWFVVNVERYFVKIL